MLKIVTIPNKNLRTRSTEIDRDILLSKEIQKFAQDMIPMMYKADGVGLAAPQVGKNIRLCVIGKEGIKKDSKATVSKNEDLILVNPVWVKKNKKKNSDVEGCLSVPKTFGSVSRYSDIHVTALDSNGNPMTFDAHGFFARVIQHEVDHLDGILFIDKATNIYTVD
ncbi:MAG: peptide deformylase [Candidatus Magasanikbacteria bacterium]